MPRCATCISAVPHKTILMINDDDNKNRYCIKTDNTQLVSPWRAYGKQSLAEDIVTASRRNRLLIRLWLHVLVLTILYVNEYFLGTYWHHWLANFKLWSVVLSCCLRAVANAVIVAGVGRWCLWWAITHPLHARCRWCRRWLQSHRVNSPALCYSFIAVHVSEGFLGHVSFEYIKFISAWLFLSF